MNLGFPATMEVVSFGLGLATGQIRYYFAVKCAESTMLTFNK